MLKHFFFFLEGKTSGLACNIKALSFSGFWKFLFKIVIGHWGLVQFSGYTGVSQVTLVVKNLPANGGATGETGSIPGLGRSPGAAAWQPSLIFLPGESHGPRRLAGYSP